jgi:hypothetical protein
MADLHSTHNKFDLADVGVTRAHCPVSASALLQQLCFSDWVAFAAAATTAAVITSDLSPRTRREGIERKPRPFSDADHRPAVADGSYPLFFTSTHGEAPQGWC